MIRSNEANNDPPEPWVLRLAAELRAFTQDEEGSWGEVDEVTVARYLDGLCTPHEKRNVEQAMIEHAAVRELVLYLQSSGKQTKRQRLIPYWVPIKIAAAALVLAVTGLLAIVALYPLNWTGGGQDQPDTPSRLSLDRVDAFVQRAEQLRGVSPDDERVLKLRSDFVHSPVEVAALAWSRDDFLAFMLRTSPTRRDQLEAEVEAQVKGVMASQALPAGQPAQFDSYKKTVLASARQVVGDSGGERGQAFQPLLLAAGSERVGMIVPLYCDKMDEPDRLSWDRVVNLADKNLPIKIINTRQYTSDLTADGRYVTEFKKAVAFAASRGVEVYGYVNCNGGTKKLADAEAEVVKWHEFYGGQIQGIFFNNQPMAQDSRLEFFARLFAFAKDTEPAWKIISATNGGCDEGYIRLTEDGIICYKTNGVFPKFNGWEKPYGSSRFGALVHNVGQLSDKDFRTMASAFGWVFVTGKAKPVDTYHVLPEYMEREAAILKGINASKPPARKATGDPGQPKRSA